MILNRAVQRQKAAEERKEWLIDELLDYGYFKMPDGRQLHELSLPELETKYIQVRCNVGKVISKED